ncbi:MAG: tRNA epoxyqueuosine(34) reductase QueG [Planctomycetes bacterium]|nr:tRNA epoxyqueuosine(34) reductase QueG [Planctomycetota bacterium]
MTESIKQKALAIGFDLVGVTGADLVDAAQAELFRKWLNAGYAAEMQYMQRNLEKRLNPAKLMEGAKSVICVGVDYNPANRPPPPPRPDSANYGRIANFALYEDYHSFIKDRLRLLADFINASVEGDSFRFKICVDSVPLAERALAQRAGLGFIGRNHMLINPDLGPQILLGEIVTNLELAGDQPAAGDCSGCDKCIKACPTGALDADGNLDARKCVSYLTTELKGQIPDSLKAKMGTSLFGCDKCMLACPYSKQAAPGIADTKREFKFFPQRRWTELNDIDGWDTDRFDKSFANSTIKRLGLERLRRNAKVCMDNIAGD